MKKPHVAVIGAGHWGKNHLRVWQELGHLAAICDSDPALLSATVDQYPGVRRSTEAQELFADPEIDAAVIATPAGTHMRLAEKALTAGKDVLVEKPLALSLDDGQSLVNTARHLGKILMVGHVLEFHPAMSKLRELVADGSLGQLRYIYSNRLNFGRFRTEESALWSFAPHDIAIMIRIIGALPEKVTCHGGSYLNDALADTTITALEFPGEVRGHIYVSWLHPFKEHRLVVIGDRRMAVFDDTAPWPEKLMCFPHSVDWIDGQVPSARKAEAEVVSLNEAEPLKLQSEAFLDSIRTRQSPLTDGASGLAVLAVLTAAEGSLGNGGRPEELAGPLSAYFHPTATVASSAQIGEGSRVWHHVHVMDRAQIGRDCVLGQNVFVGEGVRIGDGVKIQNNVSVYSGVELEDRVFCGPSVVFTNVLNPRADIDRKHEFRRTLVREGATLGANATVLCGVTIGPYAMIGAGAVVTKNVPAHALIVGLPGRPTGWVCRCGHRLTEFEGEFTCPMDGQTYRLVENGLVVVE